MKQVWLTLLALVVFTSCAMGQAARTATLVGNVTDPTGAAVPGAKVVVVNTQTRFESNGVTNAEGAYYIPFLAVGPYELTVQAAGFKKFVQAGIQLRAGEVPRVDVRLEVGSVTESIEVTGAAPLLQTETAQVSQTMDAQTLTGLPVLQLKAQRVLYYMAGVSSRAANHSVVGLAENQLGYTLDGISGKTSVRDTIGDMDTNVQPTVDALAEAKIYTTGLPAEVGHGAGGMIAYTFKSGTNSLHGTAEDRYQSKSMVHRNYFEQNARVNPYSFHQMQATLTGPIVLPKLYDGRNKTFFLFAFGRHHEKADDPQSSTVPDDAMLNGDFSFPQATGGGYPIYNPRTIRQVGTTWTSDPYVGNIVPKADWDQVSKNFLALDPWKRANVPGSYTRSGPSGNWSGYTLYRSYRSRYDFKFDHQISPNNKFFIRESWNRHRRTGRINGWVNNRLLDSSDYSFGRPQPVDQYNWAFADYHIFSPTFMNEVRLGFGRRVGMVDPPTAGQCWAQKLGIPNVNCAHFPGIGSYGIGPGAFSRSINEDITFQNNTTKVAGRNTIKFGYEVLRTRANNVSATTSSGNYTFGGTALPFTPNTGNSFASFLLGGVTSATFTEQRFNWLPRWWTHSFFVQTDYKPLPKLTLNLGLRYSLETPFQTKYGQKSQWDPNVVDPVTGKLGAITHPSGTVYATDKNNFQPRFGMAWNLHRKVVFRGSWGLLFEDRLPSAGSQEYSSSVSISQPTGDPRVAFYLSQGPPNRVFNVNPDGTTPFVGTSYSGRGATYLDPNLRVPYVMNWSGGFQFDLGHQWMHELVYQGSAGVARATTVNINELPLSIYDSKDLTLLNAVYSATQNYRPWTHFGTISYANNAGHSTYHGMTARIEKRYTDNGLILNAYYTWSKNLSGGTASGNKYYNWRLSKGPTSFDTRHYIVINAHYELPFGRSRRFLNQSRYLDYVLGGWELGWIQSILSGPPVTFSASGSPNRYLSGQGGLHQIVPDDKVMIKNWDIGPHRFPQSAQNPLYDIKAFAYPAAFTMGALGNGTGRGLWLMWPQWTLGKEWRIAERFRYSMTLNGNNIPMRMNFVTPNTTADINSPSLFGKFPAAGQNTSQLGTQNGNLILFLRLEF